MTDNKNNRGINEALKQAAIDYRAERDKAGASATPSHNVDRDVDRLAKLPPYAYDLVREHHAEQLGIRISTLDKMIAKRRKKLGLDDENTPPPFPAVDPSPHPVAGDDLLHQIVDRLKQHVIFSDEAAHAWRCGKLSPGRMTRPRILRCCW